MTQLVPHNNLVFTDFDSTEGLLVDLNTKKYYQLNETATLIWKALEQGLVADQIADKLVAAYEVTQIDARQSVEATLQKLQAYKLISDQQV